MSNVVPITGETAHPAASPFPQESELYFTAVERDLCWKHKDGVSHFPVPTHKMLLRADAQRVPIPLAVVGKGWGLVQNEALFQSVEAQFQHAFTTDELEGVRVVDSMSYGGRVCLRQYIFPNVRCTQQLGVSDVSFRTILKNAFGYGSLVLYSGAIDMFCTNGMIVGQFDAMYARHTKGLQISNIVERVRRSIDVFYKQADIWAQWYGKKINDSVVEQFLEQMYSDRLAAQLLRQYRIEVHTHGPTVWALYSTLTYYATHNEGAFAVRQTDSDHGAATLLKREEQVRRLTNSETWEALAA